MKALPDAQYLRECLSYDPESGQLTWRERPLSHFKTVGAQHTWNTRYAGKTAGSPQSNGYLHVAIDNVKYLTHRVIWKLVTGDEPGPLLDHRDLNKRNNVWENLRQASKVLNSINGLGHTRRSEIGLKGVARKRNRYRAFITINQKYVSLGSFDTPEEAHAAYCAKAKELYPTFFNPGS